MELKEPFTVCRFPKLEEEEEEDDEDEEDDRRKFRMKNKKSLTNIVVIFKQIINKFNLFFILKEWLKRKR